MKYRVGQKVRVVDATEDSAACRGETGTVYGAKQSDQYHDYPYPYAVWMDRGVNGRQLYFFTELELEAIDG